MRHLDRPGVFVSLLVGCSLLLCAPALVWPLMPDEAGFLLVSRGWDPGPGTLYGPLWVDRPPLLIATYALSDHLFGTYGARVVAAVLTMAAVAAAYRLGALVGGRPAARVAGTVAVVLTGWPSLVTWSGKSESLGVPLVIISCWLVLEALERTSTRSAVGAALAAGVTATTAVGMKQSLVSAVVFIAVLLVLRLLLRRDRRSVLLLGAAVVGGLLPFLAVMLWAERNGVGAGLLWDVLGRFRGQALEVIAGRESPANRARALRLIWLAVATGSAVILTLFLLRLPRIVTRRATVALAATAMVVVDVFAVAAGGSYWAPYLQGLTPASVLAAALLMTVGGRTARTTSVFSVLMVVPLLISLVVTLPPRESTATVYGQQVGRSIADVARDDDSIVVLYGGANIVLASGLSTPYEYLWSLPIRTLDPTLGALRGVVTGDEPPTWIVRLHPVSSWGLDADHRLREAIGERYERHGRVCGLDVYLLRDADRATLPSPACPDDLDDAAGTGRDTQDVSSG